jgi:CheY-like chemotaxis protein
MEREGLRVLVVDDDRSVRFAIPAFLTAYGHQVMVAAGCEAAAELLAHHPFDAVCLDLRLGSGFQEDGWQVVAAVKRWCPGAGIVVLSAYADERTAQRAAELGVAAVLLKPQPLELVQAELRAAVRGRS